MQSKLIQDKVNETCEKLYGVKHYSQSDEFADKLRHAWSIKTDLEVQTITNQRIHTNNERYGGIGFASP